MSKKSEQFIKDMIRCRGMDWVRLGMMVEVAGDIGTIKGMNDSANLDVSFANEIKRGKGTDNCHPTWDIRYFDENNVVIRDFRVDKTNPEETIEKLRAENDELKKANEWHEWKPIETMPQDGSNFDVFLYDTTTVINKCHTDAAKNVWVRHGYPTVTTLIKGATHWKPITHPK